MNITHFGRAVAMLLALSTAAFAAAPTHLAGRSVRRVRQDGDGLEGERVRHAPLAGRQLVGPDLPTDAGQEIDHRRPMVA
jgi:hypothetical protein